MVFFLRFFYLDGLCFIPITLINFSANCNGNSTEINWSTSSEINNDYFTLEKSTDGKNFIEIGIIEGAGNNNSRRDYQFLDNKLSYQGNYYRLNRKAFYFKSHS